MEFRSTNPRLSRGHRGYKFWKVQLRPVSLKEQRHDRKLFIKWKKTKLLLL